MSNIKQIVEYRTAFNNINTLIIKYANWANDFDLTELNKIKTEYKNNLNLIDLHIKLSNTIPHLNDIKTRADAILSACTKELNSFVSKVKIAEYNKFTKLLMQDLEKFKGKPIYDDFVSDMDTISECLIDTLNVDAFIAEFKQKLSELNVDISDKIKLLSNEISRDMISALEQDRANMMLKINNFKTILQNFNEEVLASLSSNKKLSKILKDAEMYVIKHNVKSNLNPLEFDEYLNLKNSFYDALKENGDYINVQAITLSNDISNFLNTDATDFNTKWIEVSTNKLQNTKAKDLKLMQKQIKQVNSEIDDLGKEYGKFVDDIYNDYAKHLTEINFKILNK